MISEELAEKYADEWTKNVRIGWPKNWQEYAPRVFEITREWLHENGCDSTITRDQAKVIGSEWPLRKGWKSNLIGTMISYSQADRFIELSIPLKKKAARIRNRPPRTKKKIIFPSNKQIAKEKLENIVKEDRDMYRKLPDPFCRWCKKRKPCDC